MRDYENCPDEPADETPIKSSLSDLEMTVTVLDEKVSALIRDLEPILVFVPGEDCKDACDPGNVSDIEKRIEDIRKKVVLVSGAVETAHRSLRI